MNYRIENGNPRACRQRGAALAVGLILLLVLTVIGVLTIRGSALELKMASNAMSKTSSFESAENTRIEAEIQAAVLGDQISAGTLYDCSISPGFYASAGATGTANCGALVVKSLDWDGADAIATSGGQSVQDPNSYYVIEYLGRQNVIFEEDRFKLPLTFTPVHIFRIVARGNDRAGGVSTVETTYMRRASS